MGDRASVEARLKGHGIEYGIYYPKPLHVQPCFAELGYAEGDLPETGKATREVLSLPIYPELTHEQIDEVITAVMGRD